MLIRRKSSTDDEYHHEDPLAVFGVITGATGAVLSSNVYDAFMGMQYVQGVSKTTQPATCFEAMSEPNILTGSGGRGVVVPSRGFQVMGKKPGPAKKQACKSHYDKNILCILFGIDCPKKHVKEPKSCTDASGVSLCEQCLSDLYTECLKESSTLYCLAILRGCQGVCHEGPGNGKDVYKCWQQGENA